LFKIVSFSLLPLSMIYFLLIQLKRIFVKKIRLKAKIISVGNIIVGGAGKTSLVIYLIRILQNKRKIGVVFGKKNKDEAELIRNKFSSVFVSNEKNINGLKKISEFCDLIIIDDGFHCNWIKKDLDILLIDCSNPFDNKFLIPAGLLREPLFSIKRADIIIFSHSHMVNEEKKKEIINYFKKFNKPLFFFDFKIKEIKNNIKSLSPEYLRNKKILAFTGIGNPFNFFNLILNQNPKILYSISYPDHYDYKKEDIETIIKLAKEKKIDIILTTEKDFIKIKGQNSLFYYITIEMSINPVEELNFDNLIEKVIK